MADQRTANRRRLGRLSQQDWRSGARTARPFLFKVDGGNIPQLRDNESSKSFLKRIKDWEKFTGKTYPKSKKLNKIKLRGTGGKKDYSQGSNWADEKKEWVSETEAAKQKDPNLAADMEKEAFLANPNEKRDYGPDGPIPTNQEELNLAAQKAQNHSLREAELTINKANSVENGREALDTSITPGEAKTVSKQLEVAKEQIKEAKQKPLKTNVHTRHYLTGERLGVLTKNQRDKYEQEAGQKTFESEMKRHKLAIDDPRRETKYTSKSWRTRNELKIAEALETESEKVT